MTDILNFDELYPGRFLKAGMFNGQPVTFTIQSVQHERIEGDKGEEQKVVLTFKETPFEHVLPKINAVAIKAMFGAQVQEWIGKRVTFYGTTAIMPFPKKKDEPCIRVYGSPEIKSDVRCEWTPPRRKAVVQILKPTQSPVLTAALAAIEAAPAGPMDKYYTRADELLKEEKINESEHATILTALNGRRQPVAPVNATGDGVPETVTQEPEPASATDPGVTPEPATADPAPVALNLRSRQALLRTVNAMDANDKAALTAALVEQFGFSTETPISNQINLQSHADFINAYIKENTL